MADARLRSLSIQQPWVGAIVYGTKRVENRSWPAPSWIIGRTVALHASKGIDWYAPAIAWTAAGITPYTPGAPRQAWKHTLPLGAVVAVADLLGCHGPDDCRGTCSPWAANGQYHWTLFDVRPLAEPVQCKGALGLQRLPEDVESAVQAQLEVTRAR